MVGGGCECTYAPIFVNSSQILLPDKWPFTTCDSANCPAMPPRRATEKKPVSLEDVLSCINSSTTLTPEVKTIFKIMADFMKTVVRERDSKVNDLEVRLEHEKSENESKRLAMETELQRVKSLNKDLSSQITKMADAHDELEAYGRRESLIFSGDKIKPYEPNENCVTLAKDIINNVLKLPVDPIISTAHRMGKPPAPNSTALDKRSIIVKFVRRDDKFAVMKAARNKSTRVRGLYANESLTPTRSKILYVLRQAKNMSGGLITGTSTINGRIFAHHKPAPNAPDSSPSHKTELNTKEKLIAFCENFIKKPLETFLDAQGRKIFN